MSVVAPEPDPITGPSAFDALEVGRITWIGLILAGIGWALLIGETANVDILAKARPGLHADLLEIAQCVIISGFALAIVGALQSGFGTLNRFFAAVLLRSNQRTTATSPARPGPVVERAPSRDPRPYRKLADGSVEVDTILGTRRFETMREAREFI